MQKQNFNVYQLKDGKLLQRFDSRKDAVYFCKVNQSLPLPDYEWEDEFEIREEFMTEDRAVELLLEAEQELQNAQTKSANRDRVIALTHLQTAILWLHKPQLDNLIESKPTSDSQNAKGYATDG